MQYAGTMIHLPSGLYMTTGDGNGHAGRLYDAATARWPNRDPMGEGMGVNLYEYSDNNPVNEFDPNGLDPSQTVVIDLKKGTLTLYNGPTNTTPVLTTDIVHGAGTTPANTTSTGQFTLGPWQQNKTSKAYGSMTSTPWNQSTLGLNAYGPYFTPIVGSNGDGIHGTMGPSWGFWAEAKYWYPVSHGCVRVPNSVIIDLHDNKLKNPKGTKVIITN